MRRIAMVGLVITAIVVFGAAATRDIHGLSLVVRAAALEGPLRRAVDLDTVPVAERIVAARTRNGPLRVRVYAPLASSRQTALLVSGLHPAGIDEPRLVRLARELAKSRVTVVTPEIDELARFEITSRLTDRIEDVAGWLAADTNLTPRGRIGLLGISFSGGLSIVAAGRPSLRDRLLYVFSFGGHDDLRRVLEYFCRGPEHEALGTGRDEATAVFPARGAHDYGVAIVLLTVADRLVPADQVTPLREAVRRFLWASYLDGIDKKEAAREFAALRITARLLGEPAATLLDEVNNRDVGHLGPRLLPVIGDYVEQPALSPARSPRPSVPIFLLHGKDDNVIPAVESQRMAERLKGQVPVRVLLTDLISHAAADQPARIVDVFRLAGFWGTLLAQ